MSLVLSPVGGVQWELGSSQLFKNPFQRPMKAHLCSRPVREVLFLPGKAGAEAPRCPGCRAMYTYQPAAAVGSERAERVCWLPAH